MRSASPTFSVIIPTYGRESLLRAIASVVSQEGSTAEVVVVADGALDTVTELLNGARLADIRVVSQPKTGASAARNLGAKIASGQWLIFLDDDDLLAEHALEAFAAQITQNVRAVTGVAELLRTGVPEARVRCHLAVRPSAAPGETRVLAGALAVERSAFEKVGGFDSELRFSEVLDLAVRLGDHLFASGYAGAVTDEVVCRVNLASDVRQRMDVYQSAPGDAARIFLERYGERMSAQSRASFLRIVSRSERIAGNRRAARRHALEAVRLDSGNPQNFRSLAVAIAPWLANLRRGVSASSGSSR